MEIKNMVFVIIFVILFVLPVFAQESKISEDLKKAMEKQDGTFPVLVYLSIEPPEYQYRQCELNFSRDCPGICNQQFICHTFTFAKCVETKCPYTTPEEASKNISICDPCHWGYGGPACTEEKHLEDKGNYEICYADCQINLEGCLDILGLEEKPSYAELSDRARNNEDIKNAKKTLSQYGSFIEGTIQDVRGETKTDPYIFLTNSFGMNVPEENIEKIAQLNFVKEVSFAGGELRSSGIIDGVTSNLYIVIILVIVIIVVIFLIFRFKK